MVAQVACRWSVTTEAPIRPRPSLFEICDGQSGTVTGFRRLLRFSPVSIISPMPHTHFDPNTTLNRKVDKAMLCSDVGALDRKVLSHCGQSGFPLSVSSHQCPIFIFIFILILSDRADEAWHCLRYRNAVPETVRIGKKIASLFFSSKGK
jgi:hypothetical protein